MTTTAHRPEEARIVKAQTVQLRDVSDKGNYSELSGLAVPYNTRADIGWFVESFAPGSLSKSIKEAARSLPLHLFHDSQSFPIGAARKWTETDAGLEGLWKLDGGEIAQRAARMAAADEDGVSMLGFLSIRFAPIRSEWEYAEEFNPDLGAEYKDHVLRTEARLLETSLVSTPAYKEASVSFVRTAERAISREATGREIAGWREYLESVKRGPS